MFSRETGQQMGGSAVPESEQACPRVGATTESSYRNQMVSKGISLSTEASPPVPRIPDSWRPTWPCPRAPPRETRPPCVRLPELVFLLPVMDDTMEGGQM